MNPSIAPVYRLLWCLVVYKQGNFFVKLDELRFIPDKFPARKRKGAPSWPRLKVSQPVLAGLNVDSGRHL